MSGSIGSDISSRALAPQLRMSVHKVQGPDPSGMLQHLKNTGPKGAAGMIICNPPYDERLQIDDIISFYKSIGDVLRKNIPGSRHGSYLLT